MDHKSFNSINLNTKAEFLFNYGEYISSIEYYGNKVDLYTVGGFYVEAFYGGHTKELEKIEILDERERRLQLYSKDVDIDKLLE